MADRIRPCSTGTPPPPPRRFPRVDATFTPSRDLHVFDARPGRWRVIADFNPEACFHVTLDGAGLWRCTCDLARSTNRGRVVPCRHAAEVAHGEAGR